MMGAMRYWIRRSAWRWTDGVYLDRRTTSSLWDAAAAWSFFAFVANAIAHMEHETTICLARVTNHNILPYSMMCWYCVMTVMMLMSREVQSSHVLLP
jgi:hypothetical protein